MWLQYYIYYIYYSFLGFPFIIRLVTVAITVFILIFIILSLKFIKINNEHYKKINTCNELKKRYSKLINTIITSKDNYSEKYIETMINGSHKNLNVKEIKILTNLLLKIHNESDYINKNNLRNLTDFFKLKQFWENKLKYGNISVKQKALRKLDELDIFVSGSVITPFTYNSNPFLRKMARYYYMHHSNNNPYKFLDEDFDSTFNYWDKIEIHRIFNEKINEGLPNFAQWIKKSDNTDFKCFMIDEIAFFKKKENIPFLLEHINDPDIQIRKHIIDALGELNCTEVEETILRTYELQPNTVKISIIKAIAKLNTGKALIFLKDAFYNSFDDENKIIIANTIYNYNSEGKEMFNKMKKENNNDFINLIFEHVTNPLINTSAYV